MLINANIGVGCVLQFTPEGRAGGGAGGPTSYFEAFFGGTNSGPPQTIGGLHYQTSSQVLTGGAGVGGTSSVSPG